MGEVLSNVIIPIIIIAIVIIIMLATGYVKASPDTAYIISGLRKHPKVLIGKAGVKVPFFEKKDELNLDLTDGYLTISASKDLDKDEEDKKGKYIRKERYAGSMSRSFYVGDGITEEDIKAKYENGILKLSIPKKEAKAVDQKKHIAIEG